MKENQSLIQQTATLGSGSYAASSANSYWNQNTAGSYVAPNLQWQTTSSNATYLSAASALGK